MNSKLNFFILEFLFFLTAYLLLELLVDDDLVELLLERLTEEERLGVELRLIEDDLLLLGLVTLVLVLLLEELALGLVILLVVVRVVGELVLTLGDVTLVELPLLIVVEFERTLEELFDLLVLVFEYEFLLLLYPFLFTTEFPRLVEL